MGGKLLINIFLSVLLGLFDGIGLALFIPLLTFVGGGTDASMPSKSEMGGLQFILEGFSLLHIPFNLVAVLCFMLSVFLLKAMLNYYITMEQVDLKQKYMVNLRFKQIELLERLSFKGFLTLDSGMVQNNITTEVNKNVYAMVSFLTTTKAVIILATYIVLAFLANWQFAFLIILGGWMTNLFFNRINQIVKETSILMSKRGTLFSGYVIQMINTFKYIKSTAQDKYTQKLKSVVREIEGMNRTIGRNQAITLSVREPILIAIVSLVILIQVYWAGDSLASIMLSLLLFYRALTGLMAVQTGWQTFMQNVGSIESVQQFTALLSEHTEDFSDKPPYAGFNRIVVKNLAFAYGKKKVLNDVSLIIPKNTTVALVGESGSGKSTLANLIVGLIPPAQGDIALDDTPYEHLNLDTFRKKIGYITQESVVYNDTLFNNVTFWSEKTAENISRFNEVINLVALSDFVDKLVSKEDTILGDNGIMVSGGQKQRISIARELYKKVDLMVLDEATAALDAETENAVQESLGLIRGKTTMLVIAHRLATIKNADQIYLLEEGSVVGQGTFNQLRATSEKFNRMVELQSFD